VDQFATTPRLDGQIFIIACDGVWDVMDNESVAEFARRQKTPGAAARAIRNVALERGPTDNVSVVFLTRK
jgi:serine/threonine protein phosphatase PrpC